MEALVFMQNSKDKECIVAKKTCCTVDARKASDWIKPGVSTSNHKRLAGENSMRLIIVGDECYGSGTNQIQITTSW